MYTRIKQKVILVPTKCWVGKLRPEIGTSDRMFDQEYLTSKNNQGARGTPM